MNRRQRLGGIALAGSVILVGCGHAPGLQPTLRTPGAELSPAATVARLAGSLLVSARVAKYRVQDVAGDGYQAGDLTSVVLTVRDSQGAVLSTAMLGPNDLLSQVAFTNLPYGTLSITAQAYSGAQQINLNDPLWLNPLQVTIDDSQPFPVTLQLRLDDLYQQTANATFNGIGITAGNFITSTASIGITTVQAQITAASNNVVAAGSPLTGALKIGSYELRIGNIVDDTEMGGKNATWTLASAGADLGSFTGHYATGSAVTVPVSFGGIAGSLSFMTADIDAAMLTPASDSIDVTAP